MADKDKQRGQDAVIGPGTHVTGDVQGEGDLLVRGRVTGKIQLSDTLTIEAGAVVQADIIVRKLIVSGVLVGGVTAGESVHLTDKARVVGDINVPNLVMDPGAAYRGRVQMDGVGGAASSSKVKASPGPQRPERAEAGAAAASPLWAKKKLKRRPGGL
jgi:cytoskeletal protein CcmA (bactofilin family)